MTDGTRQHHTVAKREQKEGVKRDTKENNKTQWGAATRWRGRGGYRFYSARRRTRGWGARMRTAVKEWEGGVVSDEGLRSPLRAQGGKRTTRRRGNKRKRNRPSCWRWMRAAQGQRSHRGVPLTLLRGDQRPAGGGSQGRTGLPAGPTQPRHYTSEDSPAGSRARQKGEGGGHGIGSE